MARVASLPGPDPTAPGEDWAAVDLEPVARLKLPVTLAQVKAIPALKDFALIRQSRLSVAEIAPEHFALVLKLGKTKL